MRDEFSRQSKEILAKRVNYRCSNPRCRRPTTGPHEDPARSVNIGVAAHIAAASPGGPRYDEKMSFEERTSVSNGLWLCQACAKLIDSDSQRYPQTALLEWKEKAESLAIWELECINPARYSALAHAPIPSIYGETYDAARTKLIDSGWQPYMRHWSHRSDSDMYGNGNVFWGRGYHELASASPTGWAFCRFEFKDVYGNKLAVVTMGEEDPDIGSKAAVVRWFFGENESSE